jgi:hypothetical protein
VERVELVEAIQPDATMNGTPSRQTENASIASQSSDSEKTRTPCRSTRCRTLAIGLWPRPQRCRDARHYRQPTSFRPSRWADGLARRIPRFAYFPFGGGPRICIGNAFAMIEAALVLAFLVQRYRFQHVPGRAVVPMASLTLRPRGGLWMRLQPR